MKSVEIAICPVQNIVCPPQKTGLLTPMSTILVGLFFYDQHPTWVGPNMNCVNGPSLLKLASDPISKLFAETITDSGWPSICIYYSNC